MGKLNRITVYTTLKRTVEFVLKPDDNYCLQAEEQHLSLQELEQLIEENIAVWKGFTNTNDEVTFLQIWRDLYDNINRGIERARQRGGKEYYKQVNDVLNEMSLPTILENGDYSNTNKIEQVLSKPCPLKNDADFARIYQFAHHAYQKLDVAQRLSYFPETIVNYIAYTKSPGESIHYLASANPENAIPAIYCLREEILDNQTDWDRIKQTTLNAYQRVLEKQQLFYEQTLSNANNALTEVKEYVFSEKSKLDSLEQTYREKLKLEAPEELWNTKAKEYSKRANKYTSFAIALGLLLVASLGIVTPRILAAQDQGHWFSPTVVLIALISFIIYLIRILIKQAQSSRHLQVSCEEKAAMTRFYQALIYNEDKENSSITSDERLLIFKSLFTVIDSGLVKTTDSNSDLETLLSIIRRN